MSGTGDTKRYVSAHRLPVSLPLARPKPSTAGAPQAAFLTQLLGTPQRTGGQSAPQAFSTYRSVETSDLKRMPMGYRKALSA
ncbi:hypothetical protein [Pelagibacterium luteolum]|uniref:Uncharacterized protein n=1 Tax=Pelagibacterium luteolum TaxID=440168 RepID=A0A1G7RS00_9HYPH|nr:hypothetical protein [Pelagibacterium luteolum]SDG13586.1 hypothetical protein SAMN04487974_10189 [Pelagibacterium luteolum]